MLGKIIGGLLGLFTGGPLFAIIGIFFGHMFDRGYAQQRVPVAPEALQKIQQTYFNTLFLLLGYIAKADGRISVIEVKLTEAFMDKMGLTAEHKREAIRLFKLGADPVFDPEAVLQNFRRDCARSPNLSQMLLVHMINLALADGVLDETEVAVLRFVAERLGFSRFAFEQILRMIKAQNAFTGGGSYESQQGSVSADKVALAYQALGISETATDAEVKKAYRKLMSEYHPDKLIGQGMPEDMIKAATERSQDIQTAYEIIKKSRPAA